MKRSFRVGIGVNNKILQTHFLNKKTYFVFPKWRFRHLFVGDADIIRIKYV